MESSVNFIMELNFVMELFCKGTLITKMKKILRYENLPPYGIRV